METRGVALLASDTVRALGYRVSPHDHLVVLLQHDVEGLVRGAPGVLQRLCGGHRRRFEEDGQLLWDVDINTELPGGRGRVGDFSPGLPSAPEIPVAALAIKMKSSCHSPLVSGRHVHGVQPHPAGSVLGPPHRVRTLPISSAPDPPEVSHVQRQDNLIPGGAVHEPALHSLPLKQAAVVASALVDDDLVGPRK